MMPNSDFRILCCGGPKTFDDWQGFSIKTASFFIEIRKPVPGERDEGLRHLRNMRLLVQDAGSELVPPLDKALSLAPAYYDWVERAEADEFASLAESSVLYDLWVTPYENAREQFLEDSLLLLIKHLDEASEALTSPSLLP